MDELVEKTINICGTKFMTFTIEYKKKEIQTILLPLVKQVFANEKQPAENSDNPELGLVLFIFNKAGYKINRKRVHLTYCEKTYEYNIEKI